MMKSKSKTVIVALLFVCCPSCGTGVQNSLYIERSYFPAIEEDLATLAKEEAKNNRIDITDCTILVNREEEMLVVEFRQKSLHQLGGGAKLYFTTDGEKYTLCKILRYQ